MRRTWWMLVLALVPFGMTAWVPSVYIGMQLRRALWVVLGLVALAITWGGLIWATATESDDKGVQGAMFLFGWALGIALFLLARPAYVAGREGAGGNGLGPRADQARAALQARDEARRIVREDPRLAREMGIGRPEVPGAHHAGLVDVNAAEARALRQLPGVDAALAGRIVDLREQLGALGSVEELASLLDLSVGQTEALRERAVFVPPAGAV